MECQPQGRKARPQDRRSRRAFPGPAQPAQGLAPMAFATATTPNSPSRFLVLDTLTQSSVAVQTDNTRCQKEDKRSEQKPCGFGGRLLELPPERKRRVWCSIVLGRMKASPQVLRPGLMGTFQYQSFTEVLNASSKGPVSQAGPSSASTAHGGWDRNEQEPAVLCHWAGRHSPAPGLLLLAGH
ncbi:hypothetical protein SKAU_G00086220 [Synaphobranchus kaupii]|uniref:Uncharacterized protein n=1 Tax=Synaphobranchus kaupii TaxID=118154 RepID=A0A9Q1FWB7_SYNKA|nr:hypothetical protein SKAU_G00086220 [Synaphobranchus kaupii]